MVAAAHHGSGDTAQERTFDKVRPTRTTGTGIDYDGGCWGAVIADRGAITPRTSSKRVRRIAISAIPETTTIGRNAACESRLRICVIRLSLLSGISGNGPGNLVIMSTPDPLHLFFVPLIDLHLDQLGTPIRPGQPYEQRNDDGDEQQVHEHEARADVHMVCGVH
ncbi:hypothetical protein [Komagataeibacter sp. SM21]|uniref:hypothetical protein n=1 Tax=Komagataeibacter sp. SM21 TaxID=3242899 RepID=UPI0035296139